MTDYLKEYAYENPAQETTVIGYVSRPENVVNKLRNI